jgi:pyruvate formate lyase activating enzyme
VLVPGVTDNMDDMSSIATFAAGLGNVERVDVLPFHQMGRYKWEKLGIPYLLEGIEPPNQDLVAAACAVFRGAGLKTH